MLIEEKKEDNIIWYYDDICKYRIKYEDLKAIIWVNNKGFDVVAVMMLWDFMDDVEEAHIEMEADKSWGNVGFKIDKEDISYFIDVVRIFFIEKNPKIEDMHSKETFVHEWYSST